MLVIDETGKPVRQQLENTENNSLYEIMKELLINLARLDWDNTKTIMINKLEKQVILSYKLSMISWMEVNGVMII